MTKTTMLEYIFLIICVLAFVEAVSWLITQSLFKILDLFKMDYEKSIRKSIKWQIFGTAYKENDFRA